MQINYIYLLPVAAVMVLSRLVMADPVEIKTARLADIATYPERTAPATVLSLNDSTVSSEIAARVVSLTVKVGDIVEAGNTLARLDCAGYKLSERRAVANLESLQARVLLAQNRLNRSRKLVLNQSVSEEALDERTADLSVLEAEKKTAIANLDFARLDISRCNVTSPFPALVLERISAEGQFAAIGTSLVRVLDLSNVEISAQVPNDETSQIELAGDIIFEYSGKHYPLKLRSILPAITTQTRNREVRLLFAGDPALPGAAGKLIWKDPRPHVPAGLLVRRGDKQGVFIEQHGTAVFTPVNDAMPGRSTAVELPEDTYLVIEGHFALEDQDTVRPVN